MQRSERLLMEMQVQDGSSKRSFYVRCQHLDDSAKQLRKLLTEATLQGLMVEGYMFAVHTLH